MRNARLACLMVLVAFISRASAEDEKGVPLDEAEKRMKALMADVEGRQKEMEARFIDGGEALLTTAFQKHGVSPETTSARVAGLRGHVGSYLGAVSAKQSFYDACSRILGGALRVIQEKGYAVAEDLEYFEARVAEWREAESLLRQDILETLDLDAQLSAIYDRLKPLLDSRHQVERERLEDEQFQLNARKYCASRRFTFATTRQYFTGIRNVGDKRAEKERIEKSATSGTRLVAPWEAEKRLNAIMLGMQVNLAEIEYGPEFWRTADHDRGRFFKGGDSFMAGTFMNWCGRNSHSFNETTYRFDAELEERLKNDFLRYHHQAVLASIQAIRRAGEARLKDVEYLEKGFKSWEERASKLKAAFWKTRDLRRAIGAQERALESLEEKQTEIYKADSSQGRKFYDEVVEPAIHRAEKPEATLNRAIDELFDTQFNIAFHTRLFHEVPGNGETTNGESKGADDEEVP